MAIFHVEAQITSDELLRAVGQLSRPELDSFVAQVVALQAQPKGSSLPSEVSPC